jgi:hypothetical protein
LPTLDRKISRLIALLTVLVSAALTSCSSPSNLFLEVPPTSYRHEGDPLPPVLVEMGSDKRPSYQRGTRQYPGNSWLSSDDVIEPTDVTLLRTLARDLRESRLSPQANLSDRESPLRLRVDILELGAVSGDGVESLTLVLPTSGTAASISLRLRFEDNVGRLFLDSPFTDTQSRSGFPFLGADSRKVEALAAGIRSVIDLALPAMAAAYERFWRDNRPDSVPGAGN